MNQLLLSSLGAADDVAAKTDQAAGSGPTDRALAPRSGGGVGGGGGAPKALAAMLAVRQWDLDTQQWHLAADGDTAVVAALAVHGTWPADAAAYLARGLRDAFIQAHRQQLLALAAAAKPAGGKAATSPTAAAAVAPAFNPPPPAAAAAARSPRAGPPPAFRPAPVPTLMTLQALKLICRQAQEGFDTLRASGLRPCWLYLAHVDSFMGASPSQQRQQEQERGGDTASAAGRSGAGAGPPPAGSSGPSRQRRKGGLLRSMLRLLGAEAWKADGAGASAGGSGGGARDKGGKDKGAKASGGGAALVWEPGPVGQLQHLVLPASGAAQRHQQEEQEPEELSEWGPVNWDAPSIAAAVIQVRPPAEMVTWRLGMAASAGTGAGGPNVGAGGPPAGGRAEGEEGPVSFPELEDVELELELQVGLGPTAGARRFAVMGVRCRHALAIVAQPTRPAPDGANVPAGSLSRLRHLLWPSLQPASSLMRHLAQWAPQEEVAAHGLLLRLLE
ncbi:hypothetical protein GPECTOR_3g461 [Gonium pectorale]|uniref:Uncharacterized protein n=1 Tax=Gonium pectorale TaxID=33097 RepID=A0A150GZN9_GONPE|nr:hypothetical protein GPECTOR_3g461 [Gonium pectorale]|eukprot:KXZ55329.1 hypothetical protein GPECTOR_3g461 [Gonium pectorale]